MSSIEKDVVVLSGSSERTFVLKLKLQDVAGNGIIRRFAVPVSEAGSWYPFLKKTALLTVAGFDEEKEATEGAIKALGNDYRLRLHYTDDSGDQVTIASKNDLVEAVSQHTIGEMLTIEADITNKVIKLQLSGSTRADGVATCRLITPTMLSEDAYVRLQEEAVRLKQGLASENDVDLSAFRVSFRYSDRHGDGVLIGSKAEFEAALRGAAEMVIVATVKTLIPSTPPFNVSFRSFTTLAELTRAVDEYMDDNSPDSIVARTYGYPIGRWDVSRVTSFNSLFHAGRNPKAKEFNENLTFWDVSSGKDFTRMFHTASKFSGDLSKWDMSSAESTYDMFCLAKTFNSDLSEWDVSSVKNMHAMFYEAESFRSDVSRWDVSNVSDMQCLFFQAKSFQSGLRDWDVSNVTQMKRMFGGLDRFKNEITSWDLSKVSDSDKIFDIR